jgi:hypothetical protein
MRSAAVRAVPREREITPVRVVAIVGAEQHPKV